MKSADIEAEWQIAPGANGKPAVANVVPGGSLTFEHRNIARRGRQVRLAFMALMAIHMSGEACSVCSGGQMHMQVHRHAVTWRAVASA